MRYRIYPTIGAYGVNKRFSIHWLLCAGVALAAPPACAQLAIQHRPNVHGATIVDVVQSGRDLNITFELSGLDTVGFEHAPRSQAERTKISSALNILQSPDEWLMANAEAHCQRTFIGVTPNVFRTSHEEEAHQPRQKSPRAEYAAIGVQYSFICDAPLRLRAIEFDLIGRFPKLRAIIVNVTAPGGQSQAVITTPRAQIAFSAAADD
jgi:hypothetical protein